MTIKFEDGSTLPAEDWQRILRIIAETANSKTKVKKKPVEISSGGVTVKVGNLELKNNVKMPLAQPDYIESKHRDWTIRVWRSEEEGVYGCNYFSPDHDARYMEVPFDDASDENSVFRLAKSTIDDLD